jgi:cell division septation protein DedD
LPLTTLVVLAVFAASGVVVWLAYADIGPIHGEPPLIRAAAEPLKQAPDDPGGRRVADLGGIGDLLDDQSGEIAEERLMPTPEQPLSPAEAAMASLNRSGAAVDELFPDPAQREQAAKALKELVDELRASDLAAPSGVGGPADDPTDRQPSPARGNTRQQARSVGWAEKPNEPESRGKAGVSRASTEVAELGDGPAPRFEGTPGGRYRVQLAAVRGEDDAKRAWSHFREQLGAYIGSLEPYFEMASTDNGTFYRVQIGPFADNSEANSLCLELKKQDTSCFVVSR